jgi:hypothetical protein
MAESRLPRKKSQGVFRFVTLDYLGLPWINTAQNEPRRTGKICRFCTSPPSPLPTLNYQLSIALIVKEQGARIPALERPEQVQPQINTDQHRLTKRSFP